MPEVVKRSLPLRRLQGDDLPMLKTRLQPQEFSGKNQYKKLEHDLTRRLDYFLTERNIAIARTKKRQIRAESELHRIEREAVKAKLSSIKLHKSLDEIDKRRKTLVFQNQQIMKEVNEGKIRSNLKVLPPLEMGEADETSNVRAEKIVEDECAKIPYHVNLSRGANQNETPLKGDQTHTPIQPIGRLPSKALIIKRDGTACSVILRPSEFKEVDDKDDRPVEDIEEQQFQKENKVVIQDKKLPLRQKVRLKNRGLRTLHSFLAEDRFPLEKQLRHKVYSFAKKNPRYLSLGRKYELSSLGINQDKILNERIPVYEKTGQLFYTSDFITPGRYKHQSFQELIAEKARLRKMLQHSVHETFAVHQDAQDFCSTVLKNQKVGQNSAERQSIHSAMEGQSSKGSRVEQDSGKPLVNAISSEKLDDEEVLSNGVTSDQDVVNFKVESYVESVFCQAKRTSVGNLAGQLSWMPDKPIRHNRNTKRFL